MVCQMLVRRLFRESDGLVFKAWVCAQTPVAEAAGKLRELGFEAGWGDTVGHVRETMRLLADVVHAPDAEALQVHCRTR